MLRLPTDSLLMLQRSKWPAGLFEREESMSQVIVWVLLYFFALLSLRACSHSLTLPFPSSAACTLSPSFLGGLTRILFIDTIHVPKG